MHVVPVHQQFDPVHAFVEQMLRHMTDVAEETLGTVPLLARSNGAGGDVRNRRMPSSLMTFRLT